MAALVYNGLKNVRYSSGRLIGEGGEGKVFEVAENAALVIKVYNDSLDIVKIEKLQFMASIVTDGLTEFAAWPLDVIRDSSNKICGFVMKKLINFIPFHKLYSPLERKKLFPDKGYNFLIHVARNLSIAFYKIHQLGIVVGDVNESNILVDLNGMVALIDCDSFQIKNGSKYYYCEVGILRYTAPELLENGSFEKTIRTANTDSFSLATLIFQLLFLGKTPFTGIALTNEDIDEERAIRTKEFAYSLKNTYKKLGPAKNSLNLKYLTPGVIDSFHVAFESTGLRPTPRQWIYDLQLLSKEIVLCKNSKLHFFPNTMQECPWCLFKERHGIVYFLDDSYLKALPELNNIEQFVQGFKIEPIQLRRLNETYIANALIPNPVDRKFKNLKNQNFIIIVLVTIVTIILCVALNNWMYSLLGGSLIFIFNNFSPAKQKLKQELINRTFSYNSLETNFKSLVKQHNAPPDINKFNHSVNKLTSLIQEFRDLPNEFTASKRKIEEKHYNLQYRLFLQKFEILYSQIPSLGPAKKRLIYNNGIRTAADVDKINSIKIIGIGPTYTQILLNWQRYVGTAFIYKPDFSLINQDIAISANGIAIKKQKLEADIRFQYKDVLYLRTNILTIASALERQYDILGKQLYQSELDLKEFQKIIK